MVDTRTPEEVLHDLEVDLHREEALWQEVHRDLSALKVPARRMRRLDSAVAATVVVVCVAAAAFGVGWYAGPTEPSGSVATLRAEVVAARGDVAEYAAALSRMSSEVGRLQGELVRTEALVSASPIESFGVLIGSGPQHDQGPHPHTPGWRHPI